MWRVVVRKVSSLRSRRFSAVARCLSQRDEGDWSYSSEWWKDPASDAGCTVFSSHSVFGNGLVTVVAHPASRPGPENWPAMERWLQERHGNSHSETTGCRGKFMVLGYQWRVLHFNHTTRQSTVKVMAAYRNCDPDPGSFCLMQQPDCLAVPYAKSMLSVGLSALASLNYQLLNAVHGKKVLRVLCIGHGGGSIPLFLARKIRGAVVHSVEIDPVVINASIKAMGFPASCLRDGEIYEDITDSNVDDTLLWDNIHERLFLHKSDAEKFIQENKNLYDLVIMDAYDGDDIFSHKLWDPNGTFLKALESQVHPEHGTVVVNLHADSDLSTVTDDFHQHSILPMGKYVTKVARAYKEKIGMAFAVSVPWLCNITLVACRRGREGHLSGTKASIINSLFTGSNVVEHALDLPFPCLEYVKRNVAFFD